MTVPFTVKRATDYAADSQYAGTFEGYAAGIHNVDRAGDMILPGAFTADLPRFLAEGVVCWQHDWMMPIGVPLEATEDPYGLKTSCRVSKTQQGVDAMTLIRDGVVRKLSIGYRVSDYAKVDRAGLVAYLAGAALTDAKQAEILQQYDEADLEELFLLKKIELYEYSPVSVPANPNATITSAKSLSFADHSNAVLTAVRELRERVASIHSLRESQGRRANSAHAELRNALVADLRAVCAELDALAAPCESEGIKAFAEFQRLQARTFGVAV